MQPPRPRQRRERPSAAQVLIALVLNIGAAVMTLLLLGLVVAASRPDTGGTLGRLSRVATAAARPIVRLAGLSNGLSIALLALVVAVVWLALLGIVTGWEAEGREHPRFSHLRRP